MWYPLGFNLPISPKKLCSGDVHVAALASLDDRSYALSIENAPVVLDTAVIDHIH